MATARHCPGCRGYVHGMDAECAGIDRDLSALAADFIVPDVVPPLPLWSRLKVLAGLPVLMGVSAGPVDEPFEIHPAGGHGQAA